VAATFRPLRLAKYLPDLGHKVWVITATPGSYSNGRTDRDLLEEIPSSVRVLRISNPNLLRFYERHRPAAQPHSGDVSESQVATQKRNAPHLRTFLAELAKFPDVDAAWAFGSILPALYLIYRHRIDLVCSSGPTFGAHVLGLYLKKLTSRPWIALYGNPWTSNPSISWDFPIFKRLCERLDLGVVRRADAITAIDNILVDCVRNLGREDHVYLHPNGFDPAHFAPTPPPMGKFTVTYTGSLYDMHDPTVIYQALAILEHDYPDIRTDMRIIFAGPSVSDPFRHGAPSDIEFTGPLPHAALVDKMNESHLLLDFLTASSEQKFSVSCKLYEYMAAKRPMLAVTPEGLLANEVRRLGLGKVVPCDNPAPIAAAILDFYHKYKAGTLHAPDNPAIDHYSAPNLVREFMEIAENACFSGKNKANTTAAETKVRRQ